MTGIVRGENVLIRRQVKDAFGADLPLINLSSIEVQLREGENLLFSYSYPSTDLRVGTASNEFELEIKSGISAKLPVGNITMRTIAKQIDAAYDDENLLIDIIDEIVLEVA